MKMVEGFPSVQAKASKISNYWYNVYHQGCDRGLSRNWNMKIKYNRSWRLRLGLEDILLKSEIEGAMITMYA